MEEKKRILIIDDEEDFCYLIKMSLEAMGDFEVLVCCNGREAVQLVKKQQPDLILLDIMMPGLCGSEIAEEIRNNEDTQDIEIVFLTALVRKGEMEESKNVIGGRYFIAKPVEMNSLINTINRILGR